MKALVIPSLTGPDALRVEEVPEPTTTPEQTLVRVGAGGLNFADLMTTKGGYPGTPPAPFVVGREFAGIEQASGRRVMGYMQWGAFAEKATPNSHLLWPVPDHWSDEQGAAFPVNFFTAYLLYWQAGLAESAAPTGGPPHSPAPSEAPRPARKGRVLIHAVAGGVGTAAVQIGRLLGVEMFGTSSSDEKLARVKELGLQHGINYKKQDYEQSVRNLTHGEGVDAVFDMLGGEHTAKSLRCVRDFGCVMQYGTATGKQPQLDVRALYAKSASVQGLWLSYLSQKPQIMGPAWRQLSAWIAERKLNPVIGHVFPLNRAIEGYKLLEQGNNYGKIVLTMAG
jgi:NADPH:quinone reductase-like Zn-dependent oxidoreductase